MKKIKTDFWIAFYIAITVEKLIACDIRNKQLAVVQNLHKAWHAALRRSVAVAVVVARRHDAKGRMADET